MSTARQRGPLDWRIAGMLLGLLVAAAVGLQGPLGVSTAYVTTEALVAQRASPHFFADNAYLSRVGAALTPEWVVVVGVVLGALSMSLLFRSRHSDNAPAVWRTRFGSKSALRFLTAFAGGTLLLFGARMAGGCTSGHVISGMSQLALSGMVFGAAVFAAGIPTALLVYRRRS